VARILVSVLNIEFVPDVVNWTYRGEVFPLEIEFEDIDMFAEEVNGNDVDMHEGDGSAGAKGAPTDESTREGSTGSRPDAQLPGDGTGVEPAPSPSVPMTALRFGSFEPASAPPRLWSDRVDSDDVFEHTLPLLEFEGAGGSSAGRMVRAASARTLDGVGEVEPEVASTSLASPVVEAPVMMTLFEVGLGGGGSGRWP
jgi:hypothetical protein